MTQSKTRSIEPYTNNLVVHALGGDELTKVVKMYFNDAAIENIVSQVFQAVGNYGITKKTNPDRKITKEQRKDRHELIETMKELSVRLTPWHIPTPLYDSAKSQYMPNGRGKPTLKEEIADLILRLDSLRKLFESIEIETPASTNPGKPERNRLVDSLVGTFNNFTNDLKRPKVCVVDQKINFIGDVFKIFSLEDPVPRNI